jgi:hypothetical protein
LTLFVKEKGKSALKSKRKGKCVLLLRYGCIPRRREVARFLLGGVCDLL